MGFSSLLPFVATISCISTFVITRSVTLKLMGLTKLVTNWTMKAIQHVLIRCCPYKHPIKWLPKGGQHCDWQEGYCWAEGGDQGDFLQDLLKTNLCIHLVGCYIATLFIINKTKWLLWNGRCTLWARWCTPRQSSLRWRCRNYLQILASTDPFESLT